MALAEHPELGVPIEIAAAVVATGLTAVASWSAFKAARKTDTRSHSRLWVSCVLASRNDGVFSAVTGQLVPPAMDTTCEATAPR